MGAPFLGRSFEFMVGLGLARHAHEWHHESTVRFTTAWGGLALAATLLCAAWLGVDYDDVVGVLLLNICLPLTIGSLVFGLITERTLLRNALGPRAMVGLGKSSYALFLLHMGVLFSAVLAISSSLLMASCAMLAASWLIHRFVEEPCTPYGRRAFALRRPSTSES